VNILKWNPRVKRFECNRNATLGVASDFVFVEGSYRRKHPEFTEAACAQLLILVRSGMHLRDACEVLGLCRQTTYRWVKRFPTFKLALSEARQAGRWSRQQIMRGLLIPLAAKWNTSGSSEGIERSYAQLLEEARKDARLASVLDRRV
jgi:hypothetical protein